MLILKHLKTLQHVSIIIQIIFRELLGSSLKSLNLNIGLLDWVQHTSPHRTASSPTYLPTQNATHTHTPNIMLPHHHNWPFTFLNSVTLTRNPRAPWRWSE